MKPILQALVLAEHIYEIVGGGKVITNTFSAFTIRPNTDFVQEVENPDGTKKTFISGGISGTPYAYISLTDVVDNTELLMQFVSLGVNSVLFEKSVAIQCRDRLATVEIIAALPPLPIKEPGVYAFEIVWNGEILGSHRIVAKPMSA